MGLFGCFKGFWLGAAEGSDMVNVRVWVHLRFKKGSQGQLGDNKGSERVY